MYWQPLTYMKQMVSSQSLNVCQAAKYLGTTTDIAYTLVRHGLLNSTVECRNGVTSRRINLHAIEEFKKSYILRKELAQTLRHPLERKFWLSATEASLAVVNVLFWFMFNPQSVT